jgi:hypothetical protein
MTSQPPGTLDQATAQRLRSPATPSFPHLVDGPFTLDIGDLFDSARRAVCSRADLVEGLEVLQQMPDLAAEITGRRDLLLSVIAEQADRARNVGTRLHELLIAHLAAEPDQLEVLRVLTAGAKVLQDAIRAIDEDLPADLAEVDSSAAESLAERLATLRPYRRSVEEWLKPHDNRKPRQRPVLRAPTAQPHADLPADLESALRQEQSVCRQVVGDIGRTETEMLEKKLPSARSQREFRALVTEWESLQRDIVQTLESAMLSVALEALNAALAAAAAPRMRALSLDGLRSTLTNERIVITPPFVLLEAMIRERRDGSFGIAGPRGVGKSTLIRFFAGGPGLSGHVAEPDDPVSARQRPRLGVVVSAPVQYEARDFVLHLYAEMCKRVAGGDADKTVWNRQRVGTGAGPYPGMEPAFLAALPVALAVFAAATVTGGIGLLAWTLSRRFVSVTTTLADVGAAAIGASAILLLVLLLRASRRLMNVLFGLIAIRSVETDGGEAAGRPIDAMNGSAEPIEVPVKHRSLHLPASIVWSSAALSALVVAGVTLLFAGGGWPGGAWSLVGGAVLIALGIPASCSVPRVASGLSRIGPISSPFAVVKPSMETQLRELALDHLRQIRFQQSFSSERSITLSVNGPSPVPVGVQASDTQGMTWEQRPKTYPELVADLRTFLTTAGETYELVIGVDELDKLRSAEDVEAFLNDIKGIFGATGCFYLVSVSEDAAASFERRGTPFRDVFDSSFDDVILIQHLDLQSARKILHGLLLGWTEPFVGLCYVFSGGLARDLWRVAREVVALRDVHREIELTEAALALCRREGAARLGAVRHELMRDPFDPDNIGLFALIADLTFSAASAADMQRWHHELRSWATSVPSPASTPTRRPTGSSGSVESRVHNAGNSTTTSQRLALEMAAYLLFAATVLDFFVPALISDRLRAAEDAATSPRSLATLASARQSLAPNPSNSLACTSRFREEWGL